MTNLETEEFLRAWLANLNLADRAEAFIAANWLGEQLLKLTREDLADLDVPKDQRGEVMLAIEALRQGDAPPTLPDRQAPSYAPALSEAAALTRCRELGRPPRPREPAAVAHEYQRLRQVLEQGQIECLAARLEQVYVPDGCPLKNEVTERAIIRSITETARNDRYDLPARRGQRDRQCDKG